MFNRISDVCYNFEDCTHITNGKAMNDEEKEARIKKSLTEPFYDYEGFVNYTYDGAIYKLWYGGIGSCIRSPALILHGGPGGNHHNLVAFQALADERPVIFYDQLGCGKSDRPDNTALWTAERYFDEVAAVKDGLGLQHYHLVGHSWGTTLAVGFAARHPEGILSVSLHSPVLNFPYYISHVSPKLKQGLSCQNGKAGRIIDDYELRGLGLKSEYEEACLEFTRRHVIHTWPLPGAMRRLLASKNRIIHNIMVASGSELNVQGNLKTLNVTSRLSELNIPVLMTCGNDDLCIPDYTKYQSEFANECQFHIITESAHMSPVDRPLELVSLQRSFLNEIEKTLST
ncbi:MAG: hypothetical protein AVO38_12995 [delta proteobacterium ML8_D]|nr:MAG: hypothetical protein AVO38_12995 [delta proteobacterium ML8_D]